jgi:RNA-binding proteins (RRM domain)
MNTRLYVNNLAVTTTYNDLMDLFSPHGNVIEVNLPMDRANDPRRFGTVIMATPEGARAAVEALNGRQMGMHTLRVNEAPPHEGRARFVRQRQ